MKKPLTPVTVILASGNSAFYGWATSASVSRKGDLRIYQGLQQRIFHPKGEWVSYTVQASMYEPVRNTVNKPDVGPSVSRGVPGY